MMWCNLRNYINKPFFKFHFLEVKVSLYNCFYINLHVCVLSVYVHLLTHLVINIFLHIRVKFTIQRETSFESKLYITETFFCDDIKFGRILI